MTERKERLEQLYRQAIQATIRDLGPVYEGHDDKGVVLSDQHGDVLGRYYPLEGQPGRYNTEATPRHSVGTVIPAGHYDTPEAAKAGVLSNAAADRLEFWAGEGRNQALECDGCSRAVYYSHVLGDYVHAEISPTCGLAR